MLAGGQAARNGDATMWGSMKSPEIRPETGAQPLNEAIEERRPGLAARLLGVGESATLRVARRAGELMLEGRDIVDLGAGEPELPVHETVLRATEEALRSGYTGYTSAAGDLDLRAALCARYAESMGAPYNARENAILTVGAKGALMLAATVLFERGREVVVPYPAWVSFEQQVKLMGARCVRAYAEDGFALRAQPLLDALTRDAVAVVLNSPCNPTGSVMLASELERLVEGCAKRGVVVISDETYADLVYEPAKHASVATLAQRYRSTCFWCRRFRKGFP